MRRSAIARACSLGFLLSSAVAAVDGAPDSTFNGNGRVVADVGADARPRAVAATPDGKVVLVGDANIPAGGDSANYAIVVVRWNADGSRDTTFGPQHTGVVTIDFDLGPVGWRQDFASSESW